MLREDPNVNPAHGGPGAGLMAAGSSAGRRRTATPRAITQAPQRVLSRRPPGSCPWPDVWDALTSDRAHRPAWPPDRALRHLEAERGAHFDPAASTPSWP
jgi:hypothetical protein